MQADILTFTESIEVDLKKVRDMCEEGLDPGGRHSYCLLLTNYRGIMAIPTDPPYCLVYPIVYRENVEDQSHFNTSASPSGMCTHACMCCVLLQHANMEPLHWRTFKGSCLIIPHGAQYRTLFPEIISLCNHQGLLIDPDKNEPFPMFTVGDFCLKYKIFPGTYGDSLLFMESDLAKLKKKDICIPLTRRRRLNPPPPRKQTWVRRASTHPPTGQRSPAKQKKLARQKILQDQRLNFHSLLTMASRLHQWQKIIQGEANPYSQGRGQITMSLRIAVPQDTRKGPVMKRVGNPSLTRRAAVLSANGDSHHFWALTLQGICPRNPILKRLPMLPTRAPVPAPGAPLSV